MEREQIVKSLECCSTPSGKRCENCPKVAEDALCMYRLSGDALALIKQQDEQIFKLENRLKECENGYSQTLGIERAKIKALTEENERLSTALAEYDHKTAIRISEEYVPAEAYEELQEENERLTKANEVYAELEQGCLVTGVKKVQANTVREIFTEIYSSLDYIEEQMDPDEIPECFFSVREDIDSLKEKFEGEVNADG